MREIKFRAWDKESEQMIPNDFVNKEASAFVVYNEIAQEWISDEKDFILMQFTGLLDKNSKEIYEGDIVQYFDTAFAPREIFSIDFVNGMFYLKSAEDEEYNSDMNTAPLEVIGNIYENKNLLKS